MYFGYSQMYQFTFVPIGFVLVMTVGIALGLVYAVGARHGARGAERYTNAWSLVLLMGVALDIAYAVVRGEWQGFLRAYGWAPLFEMSVLAFLFLGSMLFMARSYVAGKRD